MTYNTFADWVEGHVLTLKRLHPDWLRLDGRDEGGNRDVVARFSHAGRVWQVHGDTRFAPVLRAYEAARAGETPDPFTVEWAKTRYSLNLVPGLRQRPKHFYVYEQA